MFQLAHGIEIAGAAHLEQAYQVTQVSNHTCIRVNVSAENLKDFLLHMSACVQAPGYFALEIPRDELIKWVPISKAVTVARDTYYLNGLEQTYFALLLEMFGELLLHDGWVNFGYAAMDGIDGVFVLEDKVIEIHTDSPQKYMRLLESMSFKQVQTFIGVRDLISAETPLVRRSLEIAGETVEQMIESMRMYGLHMGLAV